MKKTLPILLLLTACDTVKTVHIDSDPPGARIYFGSGPNEQSAVQGKSYLGQTPLVWTTIADSGGFFKAQGISVYSTFVRPCAIFIAEPPSTGTNLFSQTNIFHRPATFQSGDKVPDGVFFDLHKP